MEVWINMVANDKMKSYPIYEVSLMQVYIPA